MQLKTKLMMLMTWITVKPEVGNSLLCLFFPAKKISQRPRAVRMAGMLASRPNRKEKLLI